MCDAWAMQCAVENWPEDMAIKIELLGRLERTYGDHPIIATNSTTVLRRVDFSCILIASSAETVLTDVHVTAVQPPHSPLMSLRRRWPIQDASWASITCSPRTRSIVLK